MINRGTPFFLMAGAILLASTVYVGSQTFPGAVPGGTLWGNAGATNNAPSPTRAPVLGIPGSSTGSLSLAGQTSGTVTVQPQGAAGTYNFNLPTTAGTAGQPLLSGGGGSVAQSYGSVAVAGGGTGCGAPSGTCLDNITGFAGTGVLARTGAGAYSQYSDAQLTTHVQTFTTTAPFLSGAVPLSTGGATNFLRADGTWAPPGSSSFQSLTTLTAAASATLSDTTHITGTFSCYQLVFTNIVPATNGTTLELQVHSGGVFPATTYSGVFGGFTSGGTAFGNGGNALTFVPLSATADVGNTAPGYSGTVTVCNPTQTTAPKTWHGTVGYLAGNGATSPHAGTTTGFWNGGNGAIDGFQVLFSSGNIASGTITIYGIL